MTLWILFALLSALAVLSIAGPLVRRTDAEIVEPGVADVAVYRDQLDEVSRDLERGVITETEARAAEIEIKRRMLAAAELADKARGSGRVSRVLVLASAAIVPVAALSIYLMTGSPEVEGQPLASRLDAVPTQTADVAELVARVEGHLRDNPNDGRGWEVIAPVYMSLGRDEDAALAWQRAIRILGSTPERAGNLGEVLIRVSGGVVTEAARAQFTTELEGNPDSARAKYYLALGAEQDGDLDNARDRWREMLDRALGTEPWIADVTARLNAIEEQRGEMLTARPGPTSEEVEAAATMSADDRRAMIEGMVANLDQRLQDQGGSPDEWVRLIEAYMVLENRENALAALSRARDALADNENAMARVNALAQRFGLEG